MKIKNKYINKPRSTFKLERIKVKKLDFSNLPLIIKGDRNE